MLEVSIGVPLVDDVSLRLAEPVQVIDPADAAVERAVGRVLQLQVERGLHGQAVLVQRLRAVAPFQLLADFFEEVRRRSS